MSGRYIYILCKFMALIREGDDPFRAWCVAARRYHIAQMETHRRRQSSIHFLFVYTRLAHAIGKSCVDSVDITPRVRSHACPTTPEATAGAVSAPASDFLFQSICYRSCQIYHSQLSPHAQC